MLLLFEHSHSVRNFSDNIVIIFLVFDTQKHNLDAIRYGCVCVSFCVYTFVVFNEEEKSARKYFTFVCILWERGERRKKAHLSKHNKKIVL